MKPKTTKLTAKEVLKTDRIIQLSSNSKLGEALPKFKSSHDSVLVIDEGRVRGLINPYYHMLKRDYPISTKLGNCLFSPPKIYLETPLNEVARLMLESKVHYLPVVENNNQLLGIVTARRILRTLLANQSTEVSVADLVNNKKYLQTINLNSVFEEVLRFFHLTKLSKVVIVNKENNLKGIISLFDLLPLFQEPRIRVQFFDKGEAASFMKKYNIRHFLKPATIQVSLSATLKAAISLILDKEIGSVIVMKNRLQPENIITTSDLLRYFFRA